LHVAPGFTFNSSAG